MEEILEKWSKLGFLNGLEYQKRINVANAFEMAAQKLISEQSDKYSDIEQISFPILRRIFQTIETELDLNIIEINVFKILEKLNSEKEMFLDINAAPGVDIEVAFCQAFSDSYKLDL